MTPTGPLLVTRPIPPESLASASQPTLPDPCGYLQHPELSPHKTPPLTRWRRFFGRVPVTPPTTVPLYPDRVTLGTGERITDPLEPVVLDAIRVTDARRCGHMLVLGTTGSGKTGSILYNLALQDLVRGKGVIVIDGKGSLRDYYALRALSGRDIALFSPARPDRSIRINPLERGTIEDKVRRSRFLLRTLDRQHAVEYYEGLAKRLLRAHIAVLESTGRAYTLRDLCRVILDPPTRLQAMELASDDRAKAELEEFWSFADRNRRDVGGILTKVSDLAADRVLGLFDTHASELDFRRLLEENGTLWVLLQEDEMQARVAQLVIEDLNLTLQEYERHGGRQAGGITFAYLDEFSSYFYEEFIGLLNKARSGRVALTVMSQSYSDLRRISEPFAEQAIANTASKVLLRVQDAMSQDTLTKILGTYAGAQYGHSESADDASRETWSWRDLPRVTASDFAGLATGEAFAFLPRPQGLQLYRTKLHTWITHAPPWTPEPMPDDTTCDRPPLELATTLAAAVAPTASDSPGRRAAGEEGERTVEDVLRSLRDEHAIYDYVTTDNLRWNGQSFELDHLALVDGLGLVLVEVKHYAGELLVSRSDSWTQRKPRGAAFDRPNAARQANRAARLLDQLLAAHGFEPYRITPVVVLSHPTGRPTLPDGAGPPQAEVIRLDELAHWFAGQVRRDEPQWSVEHLRSLKELLNRYEKEHRAWHVRPPQ